MELLVTVLLACFEQEQVNSPGEWISLSAEPIRQRPQPEQLPR